MSVVTVQGVTINKMSYEQYKALKNSNSLVNNETYVITDLDNYIDEIHHLRLNRIIKTNSDILFLNPNYNNFSDIPLDTPLLSMVGTNNITFTYYLRYTSNVYRMRLEASNGYGANIYQGSTKNNMSLIYNEYVIFTGGYGDYAKVTYVNDSIINELDNFLMINKQF